MCLNYLLIFIEDLEFFISLWLHLLIAFVFLPHLLLEIVVVYSVSMIKIPIKVVKRRVIECLKSY